jgi:hypothetical protein
MAVVQLSWRDNSDNETKFKVYRGTSSPVTTGDDFLAEVTLSGSTWQATEATSGSAPNVTLTSTGNTGDSLTTGETFVITYTENTAGSYYYGVSASNAIGDSDIVTTPSVLQVQ